jgi:hypothetical protein
MHMTMMSMAALHAPGRCGSGAMQKSNTNLTLHASQM